MQLWNDYEGKTIAEIYSLGQLLRPEGRSALFALPRGAEAPAIIRLTEAINDEGQMMACWSRVAEVKQENLLAIKRFGETNFEGTPLTYAVMERTDAVLADLLKERPLTHSEAMQVATSLVAALTALHEKGLVHEHIDASNVLAVGETVKLRTDCVRECIVEPDHTTAEDCSALKQRDVHDLCMLLLRGLTLEQKLTPATRLPAPFDRVISNGIRGTWNLADMARVLSPPVPMPPPAKVAARPAAQPAAVTAAIIDTETKTEPMPQLELPLHDSPAAIGPQTVPVDETRRFQRSVDSDTAQGGRSMPLWAAFALVAVVVLVVLLHSITAKPVTQAAVPTPPPTATATRQGAVARKQAAATAPVQPGWYVVAFTFNHEDQAAKRAASLSKSNPALHPQVIAPSGNSPFLVALGGPFSRPEAEATRIRALEAGLPRDTFIHNYTGK